MNATYKTKLEEEKYRARKSALIPPRKPDIPAEYFKDAIEAIYPELFLIPLLRAGRVVSTTRTAEELKNAGWK